MIMPEHKKRILSDSRKEEIRSRPQLDPQAMEEIQQILARSLAEHSEITLTLFDPVEDKEICGIVMRVDQQLHQIKLRIIDDDWDWIKLEDVVSVNT
ncbi:YolD-like family protein [Paenibacillus sp. FSL P4-0184]|uniref:YolD-like family protein n=1 Tax=Paenibacillus sp. FSL P4-0184 TaxID=2921632 RepID=UPI0030F88379